MSGVRTGPRTLKADVDEARFIAACREGLAMSALAERFGIGKFRAWKLRQRLREEGRI